MLRASNGDTWSCSYMYREWLIYLTWEGTASPDYSGRKGWDFLNEYVRLVGRNIKASRINPEDAGYYQGLFKRRPLLFQ